MINMNKQFLSLFLVLGLVLTLLSASSGTTTMQWPNSAYFLFSTGTTVSYDSAINYDVDPPSLYDISLEPWVEPAWCANNIDMGTISLDDMGDNPPSSGYSYESTGGSYDCDYVTQGHAYWIKTIDGEYAKVKVIEAVHLGSDPEYGNINKLTFGWVYYGDSLGGTSGTKSKDNTELCPLSGSLLILTILLAIGIKR